MNLTLAWPVVAPERLAGGMAAKIEAATTAAGRYPPEWPAVAWLVKTIAGWRCERCQVPHGPIPNVLTVHHLDEDKANLEHWNLAALCQRCHLQIQGRVIFYQDWPFEHTPWMARHVEDFNEWAARRGLPLLSMVGVAPRDPASYWPARGVARSREEAEDLIKRLEGR